MLIQLHNNNILVIFVFKNISSSAIFSSFFFWDFNNVRYFVASQIPEVLLILSPIFSLCYLDHLNFIILFLNPLILLSVSIQHMSPSIISSIILIWFILMTPIFPKVTVPFCIPTWNEWKFLLVIHISLGFC